MSDEEIQGCETGEMECMLQHRGQEEYMRVECTEQEGQHVYSLRGKLLFMKITFYF